MSKQKTTIDQLPDTLPPESMKILLSPFTLLHTNHREPKPTSLQSAVAYLHTFTQLSISQLANKLFVTSNQYNRLMSFGKSPEPILIRLAVVSSQYRLTKHAEYFRMQVFLLQDSKRNRGSRHTGRGE